MMQGGSVPLSTCARAVTNPADGRAGWCPATGLNKAQSALEHRLSRSPRHNKQAMPHNHATSNWGAKLPQTSPSNISGAVAGTTPVNTTPDNQLVRSMAQAADAAASCQQQGASAVPAGCCALPNWQLQCGWRSQHRAQAPAGLCCGTSWLLRKVRCSAAK